VRTKDDSTAIGKTLIYQPEDCLRQLRIIAAEESTTISAIIGEGLNFAFHKRGRPQLAIDRPMRREKGKK
jgi:hypothetical protein